MRLPHNRLPYFAFLFTVLFSTCKPVIHSFNVTPTVITGDEKVLVTWEAEGKPSLEFNEHLSVDSVPLLEYTLIVTRGGKEARRTVQVKKMHAVNTIDIAFNTTQRIGDTVVANGENNGNQWRDFQVISVSSAASRDIIVTHSGRTATVLANGSPSSFFSGTAVGGEWTFKALLQVNEKLDSTKIPERLQIKAVIKSLTR